MYSYELIENCALLLCHTDAIKAPDICYTRVNLRGDAYGHCGTDENGKHVKCQPEYIYFLCYGFNVFCQ